MCHKLYAKAGDSFSAQQVTRFAKVIAAASQDTNIKILLPELSSWILYLLRDVFYTIFDDYTGRDKKYELSKHWSLSLLPDIVEKETEKPANTILYVLFNRQQFAGYHYDKLNRVFNIPELKAYMIAEQDFVRQSLSNNLLASGQVQLIDYLKKMKNYDKFLQIFLFFMPLVHLKQSALEPSQ